MVPNCTKNTSPQSYNITGRNCLALPLNGTTLYGGLRYYAPTHATAGGNNYMFATNIVVNMYACNSTRISIIISSRFHAAPTYYFVFL